MANAWIALLGPLGTILGALAAWLGSKRTSDTQVRQAEDNRNERQVNAKREVYAQFLTDADAFFDVTRDLANALSDEGALRERLKEVYDNYVAEWRKLARSTAIVELTGPGAVKTAAPELKYALGDLSEICEKWYQSFTKGRTNRKWDAFNQQQEVIDTKRAAFLDAAKAELGQTS